MALHEAAALLSFAAVLPKPLTRRARRDEVAVVVPGLQHLPQLAVLVQFLHVFGVDLQTRRGAAGQVAERFVRRTANQRFVVAVQLRVGLLQQQNPQLVVVRPGEHGACLGETGEVVVDGDLPPLAVLAQSQAVEALIVVLLRDEQTLDQLGHLREAGGAAQEPAVGQLPLLDVRRLDHLLEHLGLEQTQFGVRDHEVAWPSPMDHAVEGLSVARIEHGSVFG